MSAEPQKQAHPNNLATRWKPGQSGNPGGNHTRSPKISNAYARLMKLSPAQLKKFKPSNVAEIVALEQVRTAIRDAKRGRYDAELKPADVLASAKEITDRTEGRAPQRVIVDNTSELERLIIRVQERILAQTGIEITREAAVAQIAHYRPELAEGLDLG